MNFSENENEISIIITAFDDWLFPNIDSSYLGLIETNRNVFVFSGFQDTTLLRGISKKNKCKYSQNKRVEFEYDPIWWEIWLFKNYELNEIKTRKITEFDSITDIIEIAKLLDVDTSMIIHKAYYDKPISPIDNCTDYIFGYDSLLSYLLSKIDLNIYSSDSTINSHSPIGCIIDSTGKIESIEFLDSFASKKIENEIQSVLIGLPGFTIPTHRNYKVKSYYTLLLKK